MARAETPYLTQVVHDRNPIPILARINSTAAMPSVFPFFPLKAAAHKTRNMMACTAIFHISNMLLIISNAGWLIGFPPKCNPCMPAQSRHIYILKAAAYPRSPSLPPSYRNPPHGKG